MTPSEPATTPDSSLKVKGLEMFENTVSYDMTGLLLAGLAEGLGFQTVC
jgi:hypothetical protein